MSIDGLETAYTKAQWLEAKADSGRERDMLHALLREDGMYTKAQVAALLHQFMIQEVL